MALNIIRVKADKFKPRTMFQLLARIRIISQSQSKVIKKGHASNKHLNQYLRVKLILMGNILIIL